MPRAPRNLNLAIGRTCVCVCECEGLGLKFFVGFFCILGGKLNGGDISRHDINVSYFNAQTL